MSARWWLCLTGAAVVGALLAGCHAQVKPVAPKTRPAWTYEEALPGVYELPSGRTQILGTLGRERELEQESWFVAPRAPDATGPATIAPRYLVVNGGMFVEPSAEELDGAFVVIEGHLLEGSDVRMGGREMEADTLDRIVGGAARGSPPGEVGVPFRWARVEKPGYHAVGDHEVRVVGMLVFLETDGGARPAAWTVRSAMPYENPMSARILALLEGGSFGDPPESAWTAAYVAVDGVAVDSLYVGDVRVPVVRATGASVLTTRQPLPEERP